ncbi:N-acetylmuramic acid 6-phosphate etherase [Kluyvera sichuanensis]|uniref:N-acetylmuramic acid 6-phosphate etherase n=1 Tax=Kluyvera sichuanensis TaxID=2725494 RepID=A0ABR6RYU7_9ENTR|nr:N-acetylmuramic acid 6-phosphate etherase [Kluyvera sichuanensis]MBC1188309.1 N-acetylmuramic acid 6-phosphate etherase [Kluyvera sichuanensis]
MSIKLAGSVMERRNSTTAEIDRLSTRDMLNVINQEDKRIADAITPCLDDITLLIDNAVATLSHGGRVVMVGAGASGRNAVMTANEFSPDEKHPVMGLIAGGALAMLHDMTGAAQDYDRGVLDLQAIGFTQKDMLVALSVSGKTPWLWGALRHAWSLGATRALITRNPQSEATDLASIVIAPQTGAEAVAGYGNPKAIAAQKMVLSMLTTGLAIRTGRVYSNMRVDIRDTGTHMVERQIAIVMEAGGCSRAVAKAALESCDHQCKTAVLMVLTGLDAWKAHDLLAQNKGFVRMALQEAP